MIGVAKKTAGTRESIVTVTIGILFVTAGLVMSFAWSVSCEWGCERSPILQTTMIAFIIGFSVLGLALFRAYDFR